jgi:hypothetical protein
VCLAEKPVEPRSPERTPLASVRSQHWEPGSKTQPGRQNGSPSQRSPGSRTPLPQRFGFVVGGEVVVVTHPKMLQASQQLACVATQRPEAVQRSGVVIHPSSRRFDALRLPPD